MVGLLMLFSLTSFSVWRECAQATSRRLRIEESGGIRALGFRANGQSSDADRQPGVGQYWREYFLAYTLAQSNIGQAARTALARQSQ